MKGSWQQKMILSILTLCDDNGNDTYKEGMEYKSDNDMVEIIPLTKKTKLKRNKIIEELIWTKPTRAIAWSQHYGESTECKENYDFKVECTDKCTSKEQCTNKRIQNKN